jgi:type IV secretory pathway VirB10-like protein
MVSAARISFAGMGTVFIILAIGFAGGLMLARSALKEPAGYQTRANTESTIPVRVILPNSAEPAQPPQPEAAADTTPEPQTPVQPKEVQAPIVEKVDTRKAQAQEHRKRYAEGKARKSAAARARQHQELWTRERSRSGIMAFRDGEPHFGGFFGN